MGEFEHTPTEIQHIGNDDLSADEDVLKTVDVPEADKVIDTPWQRFKRKAQQTLAGQTVIGKVGAQIKNVAKYLVPWGPAVDKLTDTLGIAIKPGRTMKDGLKTAFTKKRGGLLKVANELGQWDSESWRAILFRIVGVGAAIALIFVIAQLLGIPVDPLLDAFFQALGIIFGG